MENERDQVPGICREVGLSCKRCTEDSATSLEAVCKGLRGKAVTQLFYQIYPASACASMSSHFARSYRAASQDAPGSREVIDAVEANASFARKEVTRREVTIFRPRAAAAVA